MVKCWLLADCITDKRDECHRYPPQFVSLGELEKLGVIYNKLPVENRESGLAELSKQRDYKYKDEIVISRKTLPDYDDKIRSFFEEHLHTDEEVRYIVDGAGYFDVRDAKENWIRILCGPGDLIILPSGIYHRFTVTQQEYIQAVRLFKEEPVWRSYNKSASTENMEQRLAYRSTHNLIH